MAFLREILLLILLIPLVPSCLKLYRQKFFWACVAFAAYSLFTLSFLPELSLNFALSAIKNEVFYFGVLLIATASRFRVQLQAFIYSFEIMLVLGLLIYLLDPSLFIEFGFRNDYSTFYVNQAPAFCQKIEHSELCRFQGLLEGPNKMGLLTVFYLFLSLDFYKKFNFKQLLALIALFFTFSRSAYLALIFGLLVYIALQYQGQIWAFCKRQMLKIGLAACSFAALAIYFWPFILKPESSSLHFSKLWMGLKIFWQKPIWGHGLGFSGPSSWLLEQSLIVESHFVSLLVNTGLVGFSLFVIVYAMILHKLCLKKEYALLAFWCGLLIPLNLLHSFESLSLTLLIFWVTGSRLRSPNTG